MSSAPNIQLVNSDTMRVLSDTTNAQIKYLLFSDDYYFDNWTDWVNDANNSPSYNMQQNAANYHNYVLKLYCELQQQDNACGLESKDKGAYMISSTNAAGEIPAVSDTSTAESNTYSMTAAQTTTYVGAASNLDAAEATFRSNTSINDPFFQFFYCGGSRDHNYTCYKYQRVTSVDGEPRFDTSSSGVRYLYWDGTTLTRQETGTLQGA